VTDAGCSNGTRRAHRQDALSELAEAIRKYRKLAEKMPLTLQGAESPKLSKN